jgi:hypothetical protein
MPVCAVSSCNKYITAPINGQRELWLHAWERKKFSPIVARICNVHLRKWDMHWHLASIFSTEKLEDKIWSITLIKAIICGSKKCIYIINDRQCR